MIRSLNDWYAASETSPLKFHYWCNCLGELNIPGKDTVGSEEELPADIRELYEGTWGTVSERYGVNAYVISFDNKPGIGLTWLFDSEFQKTRKYASDEAAMAAVKTIAEHIQAAFPQADVFVGENTDPDGHEIVLFIPAGYVQKFQQEAAVNIGDIYYDEF